MQKQERKQRILTLLQESNLMHIKELAQQCDVSLNTIRSDIKYLVMEGFLLKFHGSVMLPKSPTQFNPTEISVRHSYKIEEKRIIAELVAKQIPKNKDVSIFFDSSTTSLEVAKALVNHPTRITVITNFSNIAQILAKNPNHIIILCGGRWCSYENCTLGDETLKTIESYSVDYAIMGCTGIHMTNGVFNGSVETLAIKQKMQHHAKETWLICDNEKFDKIDLLRMFPIEFVSKIFTNTILSQEWETFCKQKNILLYPNNEP